MSISRNFSKCHQDVDIRILNSQAIYKPDSSSVKYLEETMPNWVPNRLKADVVESMRGFNHYVALDIAIFATDCAVYGTCTFTELPNIDSILKHHYNAIIHTAQKLGLTLRHSDEEEVQKAEWFEDSDY